MPLLHVLGLLASVLPFQDPVEWPWPPPGAQWETVPEKAFARARAEGKPILVYAATAD